MENIETSPTKKPKIKLDFKESKYATGKRKSSIAKIWLKKGTGKFYVNGINMMDYFKRPNHQLQLLRPLEISERTSLYDIRASVRGGGMTGQAGAIKHGISKALIQYEPELKSTLKKEKLTPRDSRVVERKKYGRKKARRSFQFSKR